MIEFNDLNFQKDKFYSLVNTLHDKYFVMRAYELAKKAHQGQKRDEGIPYIIHPIRLVNCLIEELQMKEKELNAAALLHDVVEDSDYTLGEIVSEFGDKVGDYVDLMTRPKDDDVKIGRFQAKKNHIVKILNAEKEIQLLKAVDWLDNLRSFPFRKDVGTARYFRHVRESDVIYMPLAEKISDYVQGEMKKVRDTLPALQDVESDDPVEKI